MSGISLSAIRAHYSSNITLVCAIGCAAIAAELFIRAISNAKIQHQDKLSRDGRIKEVNYLFMKALPLSLCATNLIPGSARVGVVGFLLFTVFEDYVSGDSFLKSFPMVVYAPFAYVICPLCTKVLNVFKSVRSGLSAIFSSIRPRTYFIAMAVLGIGITAAIRKDYLNISAANRSLSKLHAMAFSYLPGSIANSKNA